MKHSTETVLSAAGLTEGDASRVWVLMHEQPDGTRGASGSVVRYPDLVAITKGQHGEA
ncbi:hypothetical protein [Streptomyces sp. NPDC006334]|uniref:hypothetical protein n=1 Tax=Streptomyces sp. NPDC006334 TaxID=3156754 RepID=UPI0033BBA9FE